MMPELFPFSCLSLSLSLFLSPPSPPLSLSLSSLTFLSLSLAAFRSLLEWIYSDKVSKLHTPEEAFELLALSHLYNVPQVLRHVRKKKANDEDRKETRESARGERKRRKRERWKIEEG